MLLLSVTLLMIPHAVQANPLVAQGNFSDSHFGYEFYLYKEDDAVPGYDYYLIKYTVVDNTYGGNLFVCPTYLQVSISARQISHFSHAPETLITFREPDPGILLNPTHVSVGFAGVGIDLAIPGGTITCSQDSYTRDQGQVYTRYWWTSSSGGQMFVAGDVAEYSMGFKVEAGMGIEVSATLHTCQWQMIFLIYHTYMGSATGSRFSVQYYP